MTAEAASVAEARENLLDPERAVENAAASAERMRAEAYSAYSAVFEEKVAAD